MPTERPILFSAPMVRAIIEGRKTQTRRIINPQPEITQNPAPGMQDCFYFSWKRHSGDLNDLVKHCPYGASGTRLWVREEHYRFGHWEPVPGVRTKGNRQKWKFVEDTDEVLFEAPDGFRKGRHHETPYYKIWHKRLARFMPRWASRITLEIESVRVERLQAITEDDAKAEGVEAAALCPKGSKPGDGRTCWFSYCAAFQLLWESINGPGSWENNPWVWVITFKRVEVKS